MYRNYLTFSFVDCFQKDFLEERFLFDDYYQFEKYSENLMQDIEFFAHYYDVMTEKTNNSVGLDELLDDIDYWQFESKHFMVSGSIARNQIRLQLNCLTNPQDKADCIDYFNDVLCKFIQWALDNKKDCKDRTICAILQNFIECCGELKDSLYH